MVVSFKRVLLILSLPLAFSDPGVVGAIRTDRSVSFAAGVYYFEVKITSLGNEASIGLVMEHSPLSVLPGGERGTFGVTNLGQLRHYKYEDRLPACAFGTGDNVGIIYNVLQGEVCMTKNGAYVAPLFKCNSKDRLFPSIGFRGGVSNVYTNFGTEAFQFDVNSYFTRVTTEHVTRLLQHDTNSEIVRTLRLSLLCFFVRMRCMDTATSLAQKLGYTSDIQIKLRESIKHRQNLVSLVSEGKSNQALQQIKNLLLESDELFFQLDCQCYADMYTRYCAMQKEEPGIDVKTTLNEVLEKGSQLFSKAKAYGGVRQENATKVLSLIGFRDPMECPWAEEIYGDARIHYLENLINDTFLEREGTLNALSSGNSSATFDLDDIDRWLHSYRIQLTEKESPISALPLRIKDILELI